MVNSMSGLLCNSRARCSAYSFNCRPQGGNATTRQIFIDSCLQTAQKKNVPHNLNNFRGPVCSSLYIANTWPNRIDCQSEWNHLIHDLFTLQSVGCKHSQMGLMRRILHGHQADSAEFAYKRVMIMRRITSPRPSSARAGEHPQHSCIFKSL